MNDVLTAVGDLSRGPFVVLLAVLTVGACIVVGVLDKKDREAIRRETEALDLGPTQLDETAILDDPLGPLD